MVENVKGLSWHSYVLATFTPVVLSFLVTISGTRFEISSPENLVQVSKNLIYAFGTLLGVFVCIWAMGEIVNNPWKQFGRYWIRASICYNYYIVLCMAFLSISIEETDTLVVSLTKNILDLSGFCFALSILLTFLFLNNRGGGGGNDGDFEEIPELDPLPGKELPLPVPSDNSSDSGVSIEGSDPKPRFKIPEPSRN